MEQLNLDGFSSAELAALDTQLGAVITARIGGAKPLSEEAYSIKGRDVSLTPLRDLIELRGNVKNAMLKKTSEPDGLGIAVASISDADGNPPGSPYRWPFVR